MFSTNVLEHFSEIKSNVPEGFSGTFFWDKIKCSGRFFWNILKKLFLEQKSNVQERFFGTNQMFPDIVPEHFFKIFF